MTTYRRKGRLIPAHAGKTNKYGARLSRTTAHPRSRGENPGSGMPSWFRSGSSPLTRGKRRQLNPMRAASRLIPAHAGKTAEKPQRLFGASAHPRSRGENSARAISPGVNVGSSPLTRGKLPGMFHLIAVAGLIPAHAGKTRNPRDRRADNTAHPRSRGENSDPSACARLCRGSSPLTRGKLECPGLVDHDEGLIPAHAGKT